MLIVKKFGGTSVGDKDRIMNVARRCAEDFKKGNDIVLVLSAMGKTTDELIAKAKDINPNPPKRELDMLLTTGELSRIFFLKTAHGNQFQHLFNLCIYLLFRNLPQF